jgi:hypothetical protein
MVICFLIKILCQNTLLTFLIINYSFTLIHHLLLNDIVKLCLHIG